MPTDAVQKCADLIKEADCIGALTGAGISTNAGIPDFRGPQGLYVSKRYDPDKVFDIHAFHHDPKPFYEFARDFVGLTQEIRPTRAHHFLSDLEKSGKLKGIITQNIDSLHQQAGSKEVLEMHGSFWTSCCLDCRKQFSYPQMKEKLTGEDVPHCDCKGLIKPDIVFFGENVKCLQEASALAESSDLFFVIGTSCVVYPAAMLPTLVPGKIVIINQGDVGLSVGNVALAVDTEVDRFLDEVAQIP